MARFIVYLVVLCIAGNLVACGPPKLGASGRQRAELLIQDGRGPEAIAYLQEERLRRPDDLDLARAYVQARLRLNQIHVLLKGLEDGSVAGDEATRQYMKGLALFAHFGTADAEVIAAFEQAILLKPLVPELHFRMGLTLLESSQPKKAILPLRRATELAPQTAAYHLPLATALHRIHQPRDAVAALAAMVDLCPTPTDVEKGRHLMASIADPFATVPSSLRPRLEKAIHLLETGERSHLVLTELEKLSAQYPRIAPIHTVLGITAHKAQDSTRAMEALKRAIELNPFYGRSHFYLGRIYESLHRREAAQAEYLACIELDPLLAEAHAAIGELAWNHQDWRRAEKHLRIAACLQPDDPTAHIRAASVLEVQGRFDEATQTLRNVVQKHPNNPQLLLALGFVHLRWSQTLTVTDKKLEQREEARRWFQQVLRLDANHVGAQAALEQMDRK